MALVIYSKLKELQIHEKEIYEFGNWLRSFSNESVWENDDEYDDSDIESSEIPTNNDGEVMEYPWDDFSYIVIPDSADEIGDALDVCRMLGVTLRFDVHDMNRVFFVIK